MSEKLKHVSPESLPNIDVSAEVQKNLERSRENAENAPSQPELQEIQKQVESQAVSGKEFAPSETDAAPKQEFAAYSGLKQQSYQQTLSRIRQRLSAPEKAFSKLSHNKTVDVVSNGLAKTAARPSGILGGGIAALAGSSVILYMAKKYGFEYNFSLFFLLLAGGFVAGIAVELAAKAVSRARR